MKDENIVSSNIPELDEECWDRTEGACAVPTGTGAPGGAGPGTVSAAEAAAGRGTLKQSLLMSERTYRCNLCGFECDRDGNATRNLQAYTGHSEPARNLNEFPGPARSAGDPMDVETCRTHGREACARSGRRLPDNPSEIPTGNGGQV